MLQPSKEQEEIIRHVANNNNVCVDAVAGSGKSTVVLMTSATLSSKKFIQITYNTMLRKEVQEKTREWNLSNLDVHTYHSLAVLYYSKNAHKDLEMQHCLQKNSFPLIQIPLYDVIIIDEAQDMTFLYFSLLLKWIRDMLLISPSHKIQLIILGDVMQGLYDFKGADTRFLTLAPSIWYDYFPLQKNNFELCTLKMSYRITNSMAEYVNKVMLGEERLVACKEGLPVLYIRDNRTNLEKIIFGTINQLLQNNLAKPQDIFILAGSVKGVFSNIRKLENVLVERGIPCYVPTDDQDRIDERVIQGKIVFSTFHSVKGRQRKYVFIMDFDNSYMQIYCRKLKNHFTCPNTLYVACTRASSRLFLLENSEDICSRPLDFLKLNHIEMKQAKYIEFRGMHKSRFLETIVDCDKLNEPKMHIVRPTELIKFMSEDVVSKCSHIIEHIFKKIHTEKQEIDIPAIIETQDNFYEDVADLNGIAIPCMFFASLFNGLHNDLLYKLCCDMLKNTRKNDYIFLKNIVHHQMPKICFTIQDFLFSANIYSAVNEKLYSKLKQVNSYNWLHNSYIQECMTRMEQIIFYSKPPHIDDIEVEKVLIDTSQLHDDNNMKLQSVLQPFFRNDNFKFSARVDLITFDALWELKCTAECSLEHFLQVCIYAWIWRTLYTSKQHKQFHLLNIRTAEHFLLEATYDELTEIIVILLRGKYGEPTIKTDDDFLIECRRKIKMSI